MSHGVLASWNDEAGQLPTKANEVRFLWCPND